MPARIDRDTADKVKETAASIYKILSCRGLARVDMFITPDKRIVFNELILYLVLQPIAVI